MVTRHSGGPRRLLTLPQPPQASLFGPFLCNQSWPSPWVCSPSFSTQPQPDAHQVSERRPQDSGPGVLCRFPSVWPSTDCLLGSAPSLQSAPSFQPDRSPVRGLPWCRGLSCLTALSPPGVQAPSRLRLCPFPSLLLGYVVIFLEV